MPRYLLQQWTKDTLRCQDREESSHGVELWATPSSRERLLDGPDWVQELPIKPLNSWTPRNDL